VTVKTFCCENPAPLEGTVESYSMRIHVTFQSGSIERNQVDFFPFISLCYYLSLTAGIAEEILSTLAGFRVH
jgi:hypothetical protein